VNSDYTKSSQYTLETMVLYVHGEYNSRWDAEFGLWVVTGIIVRLAMRMGYHRDPSNYPGLTPFQGEMRRRIWCFVRQMDIMFSFQIALPSCIRTTDCDASLPRNIFEDEFGPDSRVLPPARPNTEPTPISYLIYKSQVIFELGEILEKINSASGKSVAYDEILQTDNRLRELKKNMAPHLRLCPIEEYAHDPATLLMQRFTLDIIWQKTMCVLHRKYITRARDNPRYAHSRRAGVDASMEILRHQAKLHREAQPDGRLRSMKWFISSITRSDYLLGAMIVCLDLHYDSVAESSPEKPANCDRYFWTPAQKADMLASLETSQRIWKESVETSMSAYKAAEVLGLILEKLNANSNAKQNAAVANRPTEQTTSEVFASFDNDKPEHNAAMTLGMLSGGLSPNTAAMFGNVVSPRAAYNYDMTMGDMSSGLTPNYSMDAQQLPVFPNSTASPFPMFGIGGAIGGLDGQTNLDWVRYILHPNP
jgi:hypothetical protein